MKPSTSPSFFVGWDVGGWNCDKNPRSRDAIVILDETLNMVGKPWRGNLRQCIFSAATTGDWLKALFMKCNAKLPVGSVTLTMAVDTPLGFSDEFVSLITRQGCAEPRETSGLNHYLFRHTERRLFEQGLRPLSAIKDMIGSQATKGLHVLKKFAPTIESCGVWTDGGCFRAIETYPAACRDTSEVKRLLEGCGPLGHGDEDDARICAVVAHLHAVSRTSLAEPGDEVPANEGWIWVPKKRS